MTDKRNSRQQPPLALRKHYRGGGAYPPRHCGNEDKPQFCDKCGKPARLVVLLGRYHYCRACVEALKQAAEAEAQS